MKKFIYIINVLLICVFTILFTGCNEGLKNYTLHFSAESIELNLGEENSYVVTIGNYDKQADIKLHFDFDKNIAEINKEKIEDLGDGRFRITVNTLMSGSTTLTITLLLNNKKLSIPVNVYESIESFSIKNDYTSMYVLRGESLTFSSDMFTFVPHTTRQKDLIFSVSAVELKNNQLVTDANTASLVRVNAKSAYNESLSIDFEVNVLNKIELSQLEDVVLKDGENPLTPIGVNPDNLDGSVIEIIANSEEQYIKELELVYNPNYDYDILSEKGNIYIQTNTSVYHENLKYIQIQYTDITKQLNDVLIVRISHKNFDGYYIDLKYNVDIKLMPKNLKLNGEAGMLYVNMFDNSTYEDKIDILMSIDPLRAKCSKIRLEFYGVKSDPASGDETLTSIGYDEVKDYVCIMYEGKEITSVEISDVTRPISVYGRKVLAGLYDTLRVRIVGESPLLNSPISNYINMSIYKSATDFFVDEKYENSTIYIKNGDEKEFDGLVVVDNDAYIGKIVAMPDYLSAGYVEVIQVKENEKTLRIKALKPGTANYTLILSNGLSTKIRIVVKEELDINNFMLYVSSNTQQGIAEVQYKNIGTPQNPVQTLAEIAIRGANIEFDISYTILPKNIDTDMYSYRLDTPDKTNIRIDNNRIIRTLKTSDDKSSVIVELYVRNIYEFQLSELEEVGGGKYNFTIDCFEPITAFRLQGINSGKLNSVPSNRVDVYDDTGYVDQRLSNIAMSLWIDGEQVAVSDIKSDITWSFSVEKGAQKTDGKGKYYELSAYGGSIIYGKFYPELLEFDCDGRENTDGVFTITAQIEEHGKIWSSRIQISVKKYEQVTSLWLSNYQEIIYLDLIKDSVVLYPYVVPATATNKNFIVQFVPDSGTSAASLNIVYDIDSIRINYNGFGGGSGILKIIPNSKFTSENEYSYSLDIKVEIGDGSEEHPLRINTFDEFKKIDVSMHYILESIVDAQGESLDSFGELTGSIKGENGGIKNLTISKFQTLNDGAFFANYYGLFAKISGTGKLENLTITGKIEVDDNSANINYVGLLCGENNGIIKNVNVTLLTSTVKVTGSNTSYIGAICGKNKNIISTDIVSEQNVSSTLMIYMPEAEVLKFVSASSSPKPYYFGGITGYNDSGAKIEFIRPNSFSRYNYYGTTSVANIQVDVKKQPTEETGVGGVAGKNEGEITNLLACGRVNREKGIYKSVGNVGGLIGINNNGTVENNISRVFISGENYIGGLIGRDYSGTIKNNTVQAIDVSDLNPFNISLIKSIGGDEDTVGGFIGNGNELEEGDDNGNICETYVTKTFIPKDAPSAVGSYYGDVIILAGAGDSLGRPGKRFYTGDKDSITLSNLYNRDDKYPNRTIVLSYYLAQNPSHQKYIDDYNIQYLPEDLFIDDVEVTITSSNPALLSVTPIGQMILQGTGVVTLTITSVLNTKDVLELTVYIINYVSGVELYRNSDRIGGMISDLDTLEVSNRNTYPLYAKFVATVEKGNIKVETVECTQARLEIVWNPDYVAVTQTGNVILLKGNGAEDAKDPQIIKYYIYINTGDENKRYLIDGEFIPSRDDDKPNFVMNMNYNQGIYDIRVDKDNLVIAPIDFIDLKVEYSTYDVDDVLNFAIYYQDGVDYLDTDKKIEEYFIVTKTTPVLNNGKYYVDYTISMKTDKIRLGLYKFIFSGADDSVYKTITVNYIKQPINNILINNYTELDNRDIVKEGPLADGSYVYNTSYTMQETNSLTAGKTNILRVNVEPAFADYSYIEVTNDSQNIQNGKVVMFSLLKEYAVDSAIVSSDSYHINNGIRVYKSAITNGKMSVLYTISTNIVEGEEIKININFYDENGEIVYPQQQKVLEVAVDKSISVSIKDRDKYLARGRKYVLDVKTTGYKPEEVFISSNSPYAEIQKDVDGTYYLQIAESVSYGIGEGAVFSISYYGERMVNGALVKSSQGNVEYTIVEYVATSLDIQDMFATDRIVLNVNNKIDDIRDEVIKNVELEYSSGASNAVKQLKATIKSSANYFYKLSTENMFSLLIPEGVDKTSRKDKFVEIDGYTVTPKFVGEETFYIGVYARLEYYAGYLRVVELDDDFDFSGVDIMSFAVIANQRTSDEKELPVNNYKQFTQMSEGNSYVLMNDIVIEAGYAPLDVAIKSFDGNGHKIIFKGIYQNSDVESYGLFKNIHSQTTIKNVTIEIAENSTAMFNFDNTNLASALTFGLLASKNEGIVYNCAVMMQNIHASVIVSNIAPVASTSMSNVATLVGQNDGYITHSRVEVEIESFGANLAGFVAVNNGHIASCYVKNSLIKNSSTDVNNATGGFVVSNRRTIVTSFIEGAYTSSTISMYTEDDDYEVRASSIAGAFIYNNVGYIGNCYSNIPISSSSRNSGFVCINTGEIENCYTTSKLGDKDTENYPFFIPNSDDGSYGIIKNCYFLSDTNFNVNVNKSNNGLNADVLRATTLLEFASRHVVENNNYISEKELFTTFVESSNNYNQSGVWFYPTDATTFDKFFKVKDKVDALDYNKYVQNSKYVESYDYMYKGLPQKFVANRPQLVSANAIAYSQREILEETYKEDTGETEYVFSTDNLGTKYNPYIIRNGHELEDVVLDNATDNVCSVNMRIISDIDYAKDEIVISHLYKTVIAGHIEGNFLSISGFSLNSNESILNSGFFAQIGSGVDFAVVQNLTFAPKYINLSNAYNVGTVAGTVYRANIYNIFVDGYKNNIGGMVVMGRDIVGGVFGRTIYDYEIINIKSAISVNAYLTCGEQDWTSENAQSRILYSELRGNNSTVAYSGALIGYVGGYGKLSKVEVAEDVASIGMVSGIMFGGIGLEATVSDVHYTPTSGINNFVRASAYGGVIVGDLRGTLVDVSVDKPAEGEYSHLFNNDPLLPQAIGGITGVMRSGKIIDGTCNIDISPRKLTNVVGGLVGKIVQVGELTRCTYNGTVIKGKQTVGGLIGELNYDITQQTAIKITDCHVGSKGDVKTQIVVSKLASESKITDVFAGGVIGAITGLGYAENDELILKKSKRIVIDKVSLYADINIDMKMYGQDSDINSTNYSIWAAGFVGGYNIDGDGFNGACTAWGFSSVGEYAISILNTLEDDVIIEYNIGAQNLIHGDGGDTGNGIARGYIIRLATVSYNRFSEDLSGKKQCFKVYGTLFDMAGSYFASIMAAGKGDGIKYDAI